MALRDLFAGLAHRGHAGVQWLLGRDRTDQLGRWFATAYRDQPLLFGLAATWLAFCAVPLAAFLGYAALWAIVAFCVFWAIFLFWAGLGFLLLVPALCVATGLSLVVFVWAATTYAVATRVLALAGYKGPYLLSSSSGGEKNERNIVRSNTITKGSSAPPPPVPSSTKPPSYQLHPVPVTKTVDVKKNGDRGSSNGFDKPKPVAAAPLDETPTLTT